MSVVCIRFLLAATLAMPPASGHAADAISFMARDHVQVFGDYYSTGKQENPLILLFHQAGSNRGEYETIGPMLATLGFNALAIDQRSGGNAWGRTNETVRRLGKSTGYDAALPDLEADSNGPNLPIRLDRSSYGEAVIPRLLCSCSPPITGVRSRLFSHSHQANICTARQPCGKPRHWFRYPYS
jgi:alpha-beta hydrolase superfamily lysophospholipase